MGDVAFFKFLGYITHDTAEKTLRVCILLHDGDVSLNIKNSFSNKFKDIILCICSSEQNIGVAKLFTDYAAHLPSRKSPIMLCHCYGSAFG